MIVSTTARLLNALDSQCGCVQFGHSALHSVSLLLCAAVSLSPVSLCTLLCTLLSERAALRHWMFAQMPHSVLGMCMQLHSKHLLILGSIVQKIRSGTHTMRKRNFETLSANNTKTVNPVWTIIQPDTREQRGFAAAPLSIASFRPEARRGPCSETCDCCVQALRAVRRVSNFLGCAEAEALRNRRGSSMLDVAVKRGTTSLGPESEGLHGRLAASGLVRTAAMHRKLWRS